MTLIDNGHTPLCLLYTFLCLVPFPFLGGLREEVYKRHSDQFRIGLYISDLLPVFKQYLQSCMVQGELLHREGPEGIT